MSNVTDVLLCIRESGSNRRPKYLLLTGLHDSFPCLCRLPLLHTVQEWVKILRPTRHKTGHFGDVLPSRSLDTVLKELHLTQQRHTHTNYSTK